MIYDTRLSLHDDTDLDYHYYYTGVRLSLNYDADNIWHYSIIKWLYWWYYPFTKWLYCFRISLNDTGVKLSLNNNIKFNGYLHNLSCYCM